MAAEAAQVRQRAGDVGGVDVLDGRVERVHAAAGEGLDERTGLEHRVMVGAAGGRTWRPPVPVASCLALGADADRLAEPQHDPGPLADPLR